MSVNCRPLKVITVSGNKYTFMLNLPGFGPRYVNSYYNIFKEIEQYIKMLILPSTSKVSYKIRLILNYDVVDVKLHHPFSLVHIMKDISSMWDT